MAIIPTNACRDCGGTGEIGGEFHQLCLGTGKVGFEALRVFLKTFSDTTTEELDDIKDKVNDVKEKVDEIKEVVDGL